eukprot:gnl/MRDRNA2_/MRDRNA2_40045_c0_seq1.p1 gnl/MRDRNA2_/MRDRNA2_40045_c0~~gnl/MRDRNA2_/MRDRNA2_40045_c0_seq1.p1  ORF type:complete len:151 (-),score=32.49 gnl/MRDRNA2_/MRDRNA2_40045_c0_seq1:17-469(-)
MQISMFSFVLGLIVMASGFQNQPAAPALRAHSTDAISKEANGTTYLYTKAQARVTATGACYCGCCTAVPGQFACTAPIAEHQSFKTDLCRSVYCTKDAEQTLGWNENQWVSFCKNECFPTIKDVAKREAAFDKTCRPKECVDNGATVSCS